MTKQVNFLVSSDFRAPSWQLKMMTPPIDHANKKMNSLSNIDSNNTPNEIFHANNESSIPELERGVGLDHPLVISKLRVYRQTTFKPQIISKIIYLNSHQ